MNGVVLNTWFETKFIVFFSIQVLLWRGLGSQQFTQVMWDILQPNKGCVGNNLENSNIKKLLSIELIDGQDSTSPSCSCILCLVYNTYDLLCFIYINR